MRRQSEKAFQIGGRQRFAELLLEALAHRVRFALPIELAEQKMLDPANEIVFAGVAILENELPLVVLLPEEKLRA